MSDPLEFADALWRGEELHPFGATGSVEIDPKTLFVASFGNSVALKTDEGLLLVDTGSPLTAPSIWDAVTGWDTRGIETIVYTHGHIDHVMGAALFEQRKDAPIHVVGHDNVGARFARYEMTAGYNAWINRRQFGVDDLEWPTRYRYPDETYRDHLTLELGGETFELHHGKGETDDATWVWAPDRELICCGDFFIWACPNAGNPQKAQRYPLHWARALRAMKDLDATVLLPGHGPPVIGRDRVAAVLANSASLLEELCEQTIDLMNAGVALAEIVQRVRVGESFSTKPYLRPIYDEPEFIIRNVWRLYGGWFDGDPARLKPPAPEALANEIAGLAGGPRALAERAGQLLDVDIALACHVIELALAAAPDDQVIREMNERVYARRAELETSTMAKGVFTWAARRGK